MKTTFSKLATSTNTNTRIPSSKSSNCFTDFSLSHTNTHWFSDTNLLSKSVEEEEEEEMKSKQREHEIIDESSSDLIFSDHAGLFESINENTTNTNTSTSQDTSFYHATKKYNIYQTNKHAYKLTNLSSEHLNYYYDDDINNWSMRLDSLPSNTCYNHQYHHHHQQQQQRLQTSSSTNTNTSTSPVLRSKPKLTPTTSWNKLKSSEKRLSIECNTNATNLYANFSSFEAAKSPPLTPTITFGQLKYRNSHSSTASNASSARSSRLSMATQHTPAKLVDQSIQTSILVDTRATALQTEPTIYEDKHLERLCFYKSLPDLNFLSKYENENVIKNDLKTKKHEATNELITVGGESTGAFPIMTNSQTNIASIEKRKTLKSIKRYRQTKQTTEPCCLVQPAQTSSCHKNSSKLRYHNSFSYGFNSAAQQQQQYQRYAKNATSTNTNSNNSSSSSSSSGYQSSSANDQRPLKSCLKRKESNDLRRLMHKKLAQMNHLTQINSHLLYIPNCGVVFTCDFKSLKNLERQTQLEEEAEEEDEEEGEQHVQQQYKEINEEDYDEDEEHEENDEVEEIQEEVQMRRKCSKTASHNDLRNKKSVSFCERISHHTITPPTSHTSPNHHLKLTHDQQEAAPLLQYNTLIKLLKENTVSSRGEASCSFLSYSSFNHAKKSHIKLADLDNISLTSLNESPPNEFKFSDDDDDDDGDEGDENESKRFKFNFDKNSYKIKNNPLNNELKLTINKLKDLCAKEKSLDNEKIPILDRLLRDNLCKIIFNLMKDNLKVKSDDLLRYEQLCLLFQLIINNLKAKSGDAHQEEKDKTDNVNESFILNEANSLQKFEAFIYFFLNFKQLSFIIQCVLSDKNILHKFYDLNTTTQPSQVLINLNILCENCKQLNAIKFNLKYYFYKSKSIKSHKSPRAQSLVTTSKPYQSPRVSSPVGLQPPQKPQTCAKVQVSKQKTLIPVRSPTLSPTPNHFKQQQQHQPVVPQAQQQHQDRFNFKTLSKKLNIKSWFTASNGQSSGSSSTKNSPKQAQSHQTEKKSPSTLYIQDPMKHSSSEPISISPITKKISVKNKFK